MYLIEQKSRNLLPKIEKKNVSKCGRWKLRNSVVDALFKKK